MCTLRFWARLIVAAAAAAYFAAVALPFVVLQPGLTGYPVLDRFVEVFLGVDFTPLDFDLSDVVASLWGAGEYALAIVFALVCFVCPTLKLVGLFMLTVRRVSAWKAVRALEVFLRLAGRLSMVDVLVTAVLVVGVKEFPGNSSFVPKVGFYFFLASAVLSVVAGVLCEVLSRRLDAPQPAPQSTVVRSAVRSRPAVRVRRR